MSETFLDGRVKVAQSDGGFRSGLDAVMLAAAVPAVSGQTALELGSGCGAASLCLAARIPGLALTGVERDESLAALAPHLTGTVALEGLETGVAGLVYALYETTIWYFQGFEAGLIAFTAAVMGGIGNVQGAVLGGLIIGVIQALSDSRMGPQWTEAIVFGYLILVMVLRPRGLLGEETREAG